MKVQIYSPYIILNKTGLPFNLAFKTWSGTQNKVAGQEAFASEFTSTCCPNKDLTCCRLEQRATSSHIPHLTVSPWIRYIPTIY